jgi:hypothetical protein
MTNIPGMPSMSAAIAGWMMFALVVVALLGVVATTRWRWR